MIKYIQSDQFVRVNFVGAVIVLFLFIVSINKSYSQLLEYKDAYPTLPFDIIKANKLKNTKCVIWKAVYGKASSDISGEIWSNDIEMSYQFEKFIFYDGLMNEYKKYRPNGDRFTTMEYFYKKGLLSAIEKLNYDTLNNAYHDYSYAYFYKADSTPLQRVKLFPAPDKSLRFMEVFEFDKMNRLVNLKSSTFGSSPNVLKLTSLEPNEKKMLVRTYNDTLIEEITYKNLHKIIYEKRTFLNRDGKIIYTERRNGSGYCKELTQYSYNSKGLINEAHHLKFDLDSLSDNQKLLKDSIDLADRVVLLNFFLNDKFALKKFSNFSEYFKYDENGLLEVYIKEEDQIQEVFEYSYYLE